MPTSIRRRRTGELIAPCRDTFGYSNSQTTGHISPHIDNFYVSKRPKKKDNLPATMKPLTQTFITSDQHDNNTATHDENDEILCTDTKKSLISNDPIDLTSTTASSVREPLLSLSSKTSTEGTADDDKGHLLASPQHRNAAYHDIVALESSHSYSNNFVRNQTSFNDDRTDEEGARINYASDEDNLKAEVYNTDLSSSRNRRKANVSYNVLNIVWISHFVVAIFVLGLGISHNSDPARKYVVENTETSSTIQCRKLFIDVLASSIDDKDATVCCSDIAGDDDNEIHPLCSTSPYTFLNFVSNLPLASRLSKFPDAWLIPLGPLLMVIVIHALNVASSWASSLFGCRLVPVSSRTERASVDVVCCETMCRLSFLLLKRFFLYIMLMMFRGWILYAGLNNLEQVVNNWHQTDCNQNGISGNDPKRNCSGLAFDFSDHIVLYYAQILPIGLMETLYWSEYLYYPSSHERNRRISGCGHNLLTFKIVTFIVLLVLFQLYIQLITAVGAYKTTSYFHTAGEVCTGFVVSFTISYPLWQLQCGRGRYAAAARRFFFG